MASCPSEQIPHIESSSHMMPSTQMSSSSEPDPSAPFPDFDFSYEEPLYTEINIPLPRLPSPLRTSLHHTTRELEELPLSKQQSTQAQAPKLSHTRTRARSLSSFPLFKSRASSTSTKTSTSATEPWPRVRPAHVKNREVAAAMDLRHQSKRGRSSTIDALAVVPAVMILSAELFTPASGERDEKGVADGRRKDSGVGRWVDAVR